MVLWHIRDLLCINIISLHVTHNTGVYHVRILTPDNIEEMGTVLSPCFWLSLDSKLLVWSLISLRLSLANTPFLTEWSVQSFLLADCNPSSSALTLPVFCSRGPNCSPLAGLTLPEERPLEQVLSSNCHWREQRTSQAFLNDPWWIFIL